MDKLKLVLYPAGADDLEELLQLLREADEDEQVMRRWLADPACISYFARSADGGSAPVGAATVHWSGAESEIIYIATRQDLRNQGYGKALIAALLAEAKARGVPALLVGTDNTSLQTIALYQKCGFRMDHIRHDYFSYIQPPLQNNGIPLRDMLVFRYELS